jgi:Fe(3+) dicitrate transport protein
VSAQSALEEMTIIGDREDVRRYAGSGALVDSEQIRIEAAGDVNQLLKTVPGLYVQE